MQCLLPVVSLTITLHVKTRTMFATNSNSQWFICGQQALLFSFIVESTKHLSRLVGRSRVRSMTQHLIAPSIPKLVIEIRSRAKCRTCMPISLVVLLIVSLVQVTCFHPLHLTFEPAGWHSRQVVPMVPLVSVWGHQS